MSKRRTFAGRDHEIFSVFLQAGETQMGNRPRVTVAGQWQVLTSL